MSQQNITTLQSAINSQLADNTSGDISAADVRNNLINMTDSLVFNNGSAQSLTTSLTVTGGITGSLQGTATTASYVENAQTASYVENAQTASYFSGVVTNAISSSLTNNIFISNALSFNTDYPIVFSSPYLDNYIEVYGTGFLAYNPLNSTLKSTTKFEQGLSPVATGDFSHAEGYSTTAAGIYSHAEGYRTRAFGDSSHSEGFFSTASGNYSHAEGYLTKATGTYSHAEGYLTTASGDNSHAEGESNKALGAYSHAEGAITIALGQNSHAEGLGTIASGSYQHVQGQYNTHGDITSLMIVGNGTDNNTRRDAFKVRMSGSIVLPTTQSAAPSWTGTDGEMVFATVTGNHRFYVWMAGAWRSGSLS